MSTDPRQLADVAAVSVGEFFRHPNMVGSVFPATNRMIGCTLKPIEWPAIDVLVEYGPGTCASRRYVVRRLPRGRAQLGPARPDSVLAGGTWWAISGSGVDYPVRQASQTILANSANATPICK